MTILDQLVEATQRRIARQKEELPLSRIKALAEPGDGTFPFEKALSAPGMSFICEVKRASPSKGIIAPDFPYVKIAREYRAAGAAAISVLTEPDYFQGRDEYLGEIAQAVDTPTLRKDFVIDEYMIYQARALGARAVLLICAILTENQLRDYLALAHHLGLSCLVEAHDEAETAMALSAGARVIGVNNRDLKTFQVDLGTSLRLRKLVPPAVLFVSESGIATRDHVQLLEDSGVDAVLVGETLMRSPDKKVALDLLRRGG